MLKSSLHHDESATAVTFWQTVSCPICRATRWMGGWGVGVWVGLLLTVWPADAQIHDSLDTYPPRFFLDQSDCQARIVNHENLATGGSHGGGCEQVTFACGTGTEALLVYPIEPLRPLDELTATVSLMSAKSGATIGLRVRFPFLSDPTTRQPIATILYGARYVKPGEFATIGVGAIEQPLRLKQIALRRQHGVLADLDDAYIDAVVINAYAGPGRNSLRIDELRIDGVVPVGSRSMDVANTEAALKAALKKSPRTTTGGSEPSRAPVQAKTSSTPFPVGQVTKILQHQGEPLGWVRTLGFDAVLLSEPPGAAILAEAIRTRMKVYAPPPSSPDPSIEAMLQPVAAWVLTGRGPLDSRQLRSSTLETQRLRQWPTRWQRPVIAAPLENWPQYAPLIDGLIHDVPPRTRSISAAEETIEVSRRLERIGDRADLAIGINSMPPANLLGQVRVIARSIGAPSPSEFRWHSMWMQTMRNLSNGPSAIVYRSGQPLSSGSLIDQTRSLALSYTNRMIAMIQPWVTTSIKGPAPSLSGVDYHGDRLVSEDADLLIATSNLTRGNEVIAGDGQTLNLHLNPVDANKTAWRLTHFSAERLPIETTVSGATLRIASPDVVELIVLSSDPEVGGKLAASSRRYARQASLDRWQLASEATERTQAAWDQAIALQATSVTHPTNLIDAARQTLRDAEPLYRAGDAQTSLRMARRADAWTLRSQWQLAQSMMPDWPNPTSSPPMDLGDAGIHALWRPLMNDSGWGENLLASGSLDHAWMIGPGQWKFGTRASQRATGSVVHVSRGLFGGSGALKAMVTPVSSDPMLGGYEGTVVQVSSPSVRLPAATAYRIDAMVKTIGFGGPHQGVLVFDSIGGQTNGLLIRSQSKWTPVRLYRQTNGESEVRVMFEVIGPGEVLIDEVTIRRWDPQEDRDFLFRPIGSRSAPADSN